MKELKFVKVLNTLSKEDISKVQKFFDSPYCNSNIVLAKLLQVIIKEIKNGNAGQIDKFKIWKVIYIDIPFNDLKWRKICNDTLSTIQKFFVYEQLDSNKLLADNLLLKTIYKLKLEALYKSTSDHIISEFKKQKRQSSEFHYQQFLLERNLYDIFEYEINMESKSNIEVIHDNLDLFYIAEKAKQLANVATRRQFYNHKINIKLEDELIKIIEQKNFLTYPEINIYFKIYNLKKENFTQDAYNDLKLVLQEHLNQFEPNEASDILREVINICTYFYNKGLSEFGSEQLQWYKYGLKYNLIFPSNSFHPGHFLNIVLFGIRSKEFTWTENFIEEYQKIIPTDQKHTLVTFSLARLYFNQHKFDQVIEKLRDVEFDELTYNLDSKVLLLATYFEVEEWPALASLADSFRTFLNRHEKDITAAKKLRYSNLIKFVKRLSKVKYQDKAAKLKVLEDIKSTEGVVNQGWLIEKANAI